MLKKLIRRFRRLIMYAAVGCVNVAIDWGVFTVVTELLHATPPVGHAAGYVFGMTSNYLLNRNFTFRDGNGGSLARQLPLFILVCVVSLTVTTLLMRWLTDLGLNKYIAKIIVNALSITINYLGIKYLVFRIRDHKEETRNE